MFGLSVHNENDAVDKKMIRKLPSTLDEWEHLLVNYFLAIGPDNDAGDIHSFEVTRSTLAIVYGGDVALENEAEVAFRKVLVNDPLLTYTLIEGPQRYSTDQVPQFFTHLILTLFIDSQLDGKYRSKGAFREKLSDWLGTGRGFTDLKGVACMWEELVRWLDKRAAAKAPFRRLVLPDAGTWSHIGYTRRLSFPNRLDIKLVEHIMQDIGSDQENPAIVLNAFLPLLAKGKTSIGLRDAIQDFRLSYYAHRRALAEHRFWRLLIQVRAGMVRGVSSQVSLDMTFNENTEMEFRVSVQGGTEISSHASLGGVLASKIVCLSANLGPAINRGILFFHQTGMGRWQAEPDLARCHGRVYTALSIKHNGVIGQRLGQLIGSVEWLITNVPHPVNVVDTALAQARLLARISERIFRPAMTNGVRIHGAWLGLPRFLPTIKTDDSIIRIIADIAGAPTVEASNADDVIQLVSSVPLNGTYIIEPELYGEERSAPWRLRVHFVDRALPHPKLDSARYQLPCLTDWRGLEQTDVCYHGLDTLNWEQGYEAMDNLLEAVYADGGSGWDEADLVYLVRCAAPELETNPWSMLRVLQDSGVIEPRLRQGWKGRAWTLAAPRILRVRQKDGEIALVEGALCTQLVEDFKMAVQSFQGFPFRRQGATHWSVPMIGATNVSLDALSERLGWSLVNEIDAPNTVPLALAYTDRHAEQYRIASRWCWNRRRFVLADAIEDSVQLSRRSHKSGTDHDVYRVEHSGKSFHYLSRCAAIIAAHAMASVPLFEFRGDRIERLSQEGSLPDLLASTLRRYRLRAAGMDGVQYAYPASEIDARWLMSLLPGCITGVAVKELHSPGSVLSAARRSGGSMRPQWRNSRLVLQNTSMRGPNDN